MLFNCVVGRFLRVPWTSRRSNQSILKEISPSFHWKDWCWSWNSNTLATLREALTHLKRPWCWERLKAGGEGDNRGWDGWMASPTQLRWVWVNSGRWWWTGRLGVPWSMGLQRVGHNWVTELNWTELNESLGSSNVRWQVFDYSIVPLIALFRFINMDASSYFLHLLWIYWTKWH